MAKGESGAWKPTYASMMAWASCIVLQRAATFVEGGAMLKLPAPCGGQ